MTVLDCIWILCCGLNCCWTWLGWGGNTTHKKIKLLCFVLWSSVTGDCAVIRTVIRRDLLAKQSVPKRKMAEDLPRKMVVNERRRYECSADECMNSVYIRGVCVSVRRGAKRKLCSSAGCTNRAECAWSMKMEQRSNYAAMTDAQIKL
jgi:hypothetical protein